MAVRVRRLAGSTNLRRVRDELEIEGLVSHTMRKMVASFLDD